MSIHRPTILSPRLVTGLLAAPLAWAIHHQAGSYANYTDCHVGDSRLSIITGVVCLGIALTGCILAWQCWKRARAAAEDTSMYLITALSVLGSLLFTIALVIQVVSGTIIPSCAA